MSEPANEAIDVFKVANQVEERNTKEKSKDVGTCQLVDISKDGGPGRTWRKSRIIDVSLWSVIIRKVKIPGCIPKAWIWNESHAKRSCSCRDGFQVWIPGGVLLLASNMSARVVGCRPSFAFGTPFKLSSLDVLLKDRLSIDVFQGGGVRIRWSELWILGAIIPFAFPFAFVATLVAGGLSVGVSLGETNSISFELVSSPDTETN